MLENVFANKKVLRHPKTNVEILNKPVCVDDFGGLVFLCQYTKKYFSVFERHEYHGPVMPNVTGTFICKEGALIAFKQAKYCFDVDMDKNCNTCANLKRLPFENRGKQNLQPGTCDSFDKKHPYFRGNHFAFSPDDPMYHYTEKCYTPRPFKFQASQTLLHP